MRLFPFPSDYTETVNGRDFTLPFHTDFRQWMRFESLVTDSRVPEDKLIITALRMIFPHKLPSDISGAASFMLWFYRCGKAPPENKGGNSLPESSRVYSFEDDFPMIAAAFWEKFSIDLWEVPYMHWWKFHALFSSLHDCKFTDICGYRNTVITDDMPDYRREFIEQMQAMHALPISVNEKRKIEAARRWLDGSI